MQADMMNLLIVDDNLGDLETYTQSLDRFSEEHRFQISYKTFTEIESAIDALHKTSFDGAIIDLRFGQNEDKGNELIREISHSLYRMPVVVLTGTPEAANHDLIKNMLVLKKGDEDASIDKIADYFLGIFVTGITRIMGKNGILEQTLQKVFYDYFLKQKNTWASYSVTDNMEMKNAVLRHILQHIVHILDRKTEKYFPAEFYLYPVSNDNAEYPYTITTGDIYQKDGLSYIVMTPVCDLLLRKKKKETKRNTNIVLLAEIEN